MLIRAAPVSAWLVSAPCVETGWRRCLLVDVLGEYFLNPNCSADILKTSDAWFIAQRRGMIPWRRTVERVPLWGVAARFLWCGAHCIAAATAGVAALRVPVWGTVPGREYVLVRSLLEFEQALDAHDPSDGDDGWDDAQWGARFACAFTARSRGQSVGEGAIAGWDPV